MDFKDASKKLDGIEKEIKKIELSLWEKRKEVFAIPVDQISDLGDQWMSENTAYVMANERNQKVQKLKELYKNKKAILEFKFTKECSDCGILIEENRLKAVPSTTRCICCQEFHEETTLRDLAAA
ncbi:MAG: TraR/DksA C4-type zinc finger protein [Bacteriovoracaceae bacterium]|jgi:RNA polymerase-binding transcription factor DksA|nr:TraR/DksA C4-type zinc finger protein [Bacteriovoracaceae bacterium]